MLIRTAILIFVIAGLWSGLALPAVYAQPASMQEPESSGKPQCSYYRSKKDRIPVYAEADTTSAVISKLKLGQEVCYIGEQGGFAIINWRNHASKSSESPAGPGENEAEASQQNLVFVRLVDLWPPRAGKSLSTRQPTIGERVTDFYNYLRNGGVPESPVLPFNLPDSPLNQNSLPGDQRAPLQNQNPADDADCGCGTGE